MMRYAKYCKKLVHKTNYECGLKSIIQKGLEDCHIQPFVRNFHSYIKDTSDFLLKISSLPTISLVPLILHHYIQMCATLLVIKSLNCFLEKLSQPNPPNEFRIELMKCILSRNSFLFSNEYSEQQHGSAMGSPSACTFWLYGQVW